MQSYLLDIDNVLNIFNTSKNGLSSNEANIRLDNDGKNEFVKVKKTSLIVRFIKQIIDPMIIILLVAAVFSAIIAVSRNESFSDVIIILAVVIINACLGVYQESKAEKSIEALKKMSAPKSVVIRDGIRKEITSNNIVVGDIVILEAGDSVPADGRIIESASLKIEESTLTGESVPIDKIIDALKLKKTEKDVDLADRKNMAYMGSNVVYGRGTMVVTSTGMNTEMGKIAGALQDVIETKTPMQLKMNQLSKTLTIAVVAICLFIFALQLITNGSFSTVIVLNSFMIAISLAVAAIPEGLPAVVTVALSIGVSKMSKRNAIIRKLTAVETLGCAQIICSDKTGTLTQNKMTVIDYYTSDDKFLAKGMSLCCDAKLEDEKVIGEPTEVALVEWANKQGCNNFSETRISEIPFDSSRKMMSTLVKTNDAYMQFTKGAPDVVIDSCSKILKGGKIKDITENDLTEIKKSNKQFMDKALRVLACAYKDYNEKPTNFNSAENENDLIFIGLVGMIDPIRPEAKNAIEQCVDAGIKTVMITGDHIDTASVIAKELGILNSKNKAITGQQLDSLSDEDFRKEFKNITVYARVRPEHKTRIVKVWQESGHVVAMTGDGVNDAPSIKSADIGVGMGITGTDVTKNVADMVLADDNFASIVNAVEEGRRIYENILKSVQYLLSSNIGEVLCVLFASIFGFTILLPVHLLFVNMVTDCIPALALSLEDTEANIMKNRPRSKKAEILNDGVGFDIVYQGLAVTILILISYFLGVYFQYGSFRICTSGYGMTMAFVTMCIVGCFHALNMRSRKLSIFSIKTKNWLLFISILISIAMLLLICFVPFLSDAFNVVKIGFIQWLIAIGLAFLIIPIVELVKYIKSRKKKLNWQTKCTIDRVNAQR